MNLSVSLSPPLTYSPTHNFVPTVLTVSDVQPRQLEISEHENDVELHNSEHCKTVETQTKRTVIALVAYHRGGSTFTGDILNEHPDVFYLYEPLRKLWKGNTLEDLTRQMLPKFLLCRFSELPLEWFVDAIAENTGIMFNSRALINLLGCARTKTVGEQRKVCAVNELTVSAIENECRKRMVAVKMIRPALKSVASLRQDGRLSLKIVHLVRDPRGLLASVQKLPKSHPNYISGEKLPVVAKRVCSEMRENLASAERLSEKDYLLLRYEDVATNTSAAIRTLYEFSGLRVLPELTDNFLKFHTGAVNKTWSFPWETVRENSTKTAFSWTKTLHEDSIEVIENACGDILEKLRYKPVYKYLPQI